MPGLLLIVSDGAGKRLEAAREVAAASAALGRPVAVLLRGDAAAALRDGALEPTLALLAELGVDVALCQTAMAAAGLEAADLPAGVVPHGLVGFMAARADWQLLLA